MFLLLSADFLKLTFPENFFHEHYQEVKWFGSRSDPHFVGPDRSKLFAKFISRWMTNVAACEERVKYQGPVAQSIVSLLLIH